MDNTSFRISHACQEISKRGFGMARCQLGENKMFGYSSLIDWDQFTPQEVVLLHNLPHGSGIDCDWHIDRNTSGKIVCSNSYHVMDEYESYIGYADFSIRFLPDAPTDVRLMFHGHRSQYLARYCDLRDYLEDTIAHSLAA